jgi:UDP-glucose 4-epimerase
MAGAGSETAGLAASPVVVTGADGFIGRAVVARFVATGRAVRAQCRRPPAAAAAAASYHVVADLVRAADAQLDALLAGVTAVVHLAGRAHLLDESDADPDAAYRRANVEATARLARAAVRAGVSRFVLASSVKVGGEASVPGLPLTSDAPPAPQDAYARSKRDAEHALLAVTAGSATVATILRLPLVYGPGVRANFLALFDAVARRRLLPLGAAHARRHLAYSANLVTAFEAVLDAPVAPPGVYYVADEPSVAVDELVRAIGAALGVPARLLRVPVPVLRLIGGLVGRRGAVDRLTTPLEVDPLPFARATGWTPPHTLADGLAATARWWRSRHAL